MWMAGELRGVVRPSRPRRRSAGDHDTAAETVMARQDRGCPHGHDGHDHKVISAVVTVNRRINDHQWRSRCNRSCTSSMKQRKLSGAHGLRHGARGSWLATYGSQFAAVAGDLWLTDSADVHGIARQQEGDAVDEGWGKALGTSA